MFDHATVTIHQQPLAFIGLRLLSITLGLAMLGATYVIAGRLFPQQRLIPLTAMTLVAGWPQFLFISRAISNDTLATAIAVMIMMLLTDVGNPQRFIGATLLSILAFLTKLSVAFTVGIVPLIWGLELYWRRHLSDRKRPYFYVLGWMVLTWLCAGLLIRFSPTIWHNWQQSVQDFGGYHWGTTTLAYWQQVYVWTISSGWAWFGWLNVSPPEWHAQLWWLFIEIATLAGAYYSFKQASPGNSRLRLLILTLWWTAVAISYVRVTANRWQPQFRFALAVLPVLVSFTAVAAIYPLRQKELYQWVAWLTLFISLMAYNLWLIFAIILPAYA